MGFLTGRRAKATLLLRLAIFIKKMLDKFKKFVIIYLDKEKNNKGLSPKERTLCGL